MSMTSRRMWASRAVSALALALVISAGCETRSPMRIRPGPVIKTVGPQPSREALSKVAVIPFYPAGQSIGPAPGGALTPDETTNWENAALVGNYVTEALIARGVDVIPPNDVELAFTGEGIPVPRQDPKSAVEIAASRFGASSVLLGRVLRYRERDGSAAGATRPASVAFEVTLHDVPTGRRLWSGRFDETQQSVTENIFRARDYPGGGTRWLTAPEFARWGANQVVASMQSAP